MMGPLKLMQDFRQLPFTYDNISTHKQKNHTSGKV